MSPTAAPPRAARWAVTATFAANGGLMGTWFARIPQVKASFGLSAAVLGLVLLAPAVGSLVSMPLAGAAASRLGSARSTQVALAAFCLVPGLIGLAGGTISLALALLMWGACIGGLDVTMNAQGVTVEKAYQRPILSSFHAAWSIGALGGAVVGSLLLRREVALGWQSLLGGVALLVLVGPLTRAFLPDPGTADVTPPLFARPHGRLLLIGAAAFAGLLTEGAASDWSGVYLRESLHTPAAAAGLGYAAFAAAMTVGRLAGDRITARLGRVRTVRFLAGVGAVGLAAGLLIGRPWSAICGFGLLGLGLATVVPIVFAAAGDDEAAAAPAIAAVSTCGYVGFLAGPTVIGAVAQLTSLPLALAMLPVLTASLCLTAAALRPQRPAAAPLRAG
ncbi:MAG: MFS transporter [Frankiaceae bacterium]